MNKILIILFRKIRQKNYVMLFLVILNFGMSWNGMVKIIYDIYFMVKPSISWCLCKKLTCKSIHSIAFQYYNKLLIPLRWLLLNFILPNFFILYINRKYWTIGNSVFSFTHHCKESCIYWSSCNTCRIYLNCSMAKISRVGNPTQKTEGFPCRDWFYPCWNFMSPSQ